MDTKELAFRVKRRRLERKISLRCLAKDIGKSASWLSKVENGLEKPGTGSIRLLARALDLHDGELLRLAGKPECDLAGLEEIRSHHNGVFGIYLFMGHDGAFSCHFTDNDGKRVANGDSGVCLDEAVRRCVAAWKDAQQ